MRNSQEAEMRLGDAGGASASSAEMGGAPAGLWVLRSCLDFIS